jgi:hypothetical protein
MQLDSNHIPVIRWRDQHRTLKNPNGAAAAQHSVHVLSVLSSGEQKELAACEAVIENGWQAFVEVGRSLTVIRDHKLYRAEYDTFETYCRAKWQYGKSHIYRLIGAAETCLCLSAVADIPVPTHEAQVRPLLGLEPEKIQAVWKTAIQKAGGEIITEKLVRKAMAAVLGTSSGQIPKTSNKHSNKHQDLGEALKILGRTEDAVRARANAKAILAMLAQIKGHLLSAQG